MKTKKRDLLNRYIPLWSIVPVSYTHLDFSVLDLVVFLDEPAAVLDYLENYKK